MVQVKPIAETGFAVPHSDVAEHQSGTRLTWMAQQIKTTAALDGTVANYASEDTRRFEMR